MCGGYTHMYMSIYVYECGGYACVHDCGGQSLMPHDPLPRSTLFLRKGLLLNLSLSNWLNWLTNQWMHGNSASPVLDGKLLLQCWLWVCCMLLERHYRASVKMKRASIRKLCKKNCRIDSVQKTACTLCKLFLHGARQCFNKVRELRALNLVLILALVQFFIGLSSPCLPSESKLG